MSPSDYRYLRSCFEAFKDVTARKYRGVPFNLPAIETDVENLRSKKRLTYKDLRYFENPDRWWFQRFWVLPPEQHLTGELERRSFDFWQVRPDSEKEKTLIAELLATFKSIELVSIILRFIRPDLYGIISPPVERVLDVRRGSDAVETYLHYVADLRAIQKRREYGLTRAADVDIALWVLHERCFGELRDDEIAAAYRADPFMLQLRARNLVAPIAELSYAQLSLAFQEVKPALSALVASYRMEIQIRKAAALLGVPDAFSEDELHKVIDSMPSWGPIDVLRKGRWKTLRRLRNNLFHRDLLPTPKETSDLVLEVAQLDEILREIESESRKPPASPARPSQGRGSGRAATPPRSRR